MAYKSHKTVGCGGWIRTNDLRVMSPTSCHCSTPQGDYTENYTLWQARINLLIVLNLLQAIDRCLGRGNLFSCFIVMVTTLNSDYIDVDEMGDLSRPQADLLVTTLHGESSHEGAVFKEVPGLLDELDPQDQEIFPTYLDLDTDTFSEPIAWEFIQQLLQRRPELRVRWAQVKVHRAVVDCNRANAENAVRNLWLPNGAHQELRTKLSGIHAKVMTELDAAMQGVPYVFDVHTMYPYSPVEPQVSGSQAVLESRGKLGQYVNAYINGRMGGSRRPLDVIYSNGDGVIHSDPKLAGRMLASTQSHGIHSRLDVPYNFGPKALVSKKLLNGRVGVAVDIPKDLLRDPRDRDPFFCENQLSDVRVELLASTFVEAWLQRL